MAEKTVFIKVGAKVDGAVAGLRKVKSSVDDLTKADLKKPQKAFDDIANKGALMGGAVFLGIGKAISSFAEFDQAMSAVAANSGATGQQLDALREKAMQLGADTQFSATEAAKGINELAKAGVSTADIMNGGIQGALNLAAAGQIDVAKAAETTASALNQFSEDGSQATHVADLLSNAANAAQGGVGDMGQALNQAGVAAHAAGLSLDETTTLLALFAKAGMTGSDAGTSLKTMMQRLAAPTDQAQAALEALGVTAYNAQGQFVGAQALLGQLSDATKDMSTQARAAAFNTIFGTDAIRAASIAAAAGADGYAKMSSEVAKAGGAAENAAKLTDNLKGDIERLGGSLDTVFIQTGSSANSSLRTLVQGLGGMVDVVSRIPGPVLLAGGALAGIALTLPKGISVYKNYKESLDTLGLSMEKVSNKAPRLGRALRGLQGVAAGLTIATVAGSISSALVELAKVDFDPQSIADGAVSLDAFNKKMAETSDLGVPLTGTLKSFDEVIGTTFNSGTYQQIDQFFSKLNSNFGVENTSDIEVASKRFSEMDQVLAALVSGGKGDAAKALFDQITTAAALQGVSVEALKSKLPTYVQALIDSGNAASTAGGQMDGMSEDVKLVEQKASDAKKALDDLKATLEGFGSPLAAQRAAQRDYQDSLRGVQEAIAGVRDEFVKQYLASKNVDPAKATAKQVKAAQTWADAQIKAGKALDITTEAGSKVQGALDAIRDKTLENVTATFDLTHSTDLAAQAMQNGRDQFIKAATDAGLAAPKAKELADNMGLIPKDVAVQIGLSGVDTMQSTLDQVTGKVTVLDKTTAKPVVKPYVDKSTADATEARIDQLARQREVFLKLTMSDVSKLPIFGGIASIAGMFGSVKKATGGAIIGAGTGTSDSIPAMLSNGEHVLTAAEVAKAGGHGAIYALRKAILTGGIAFRAQGGAVDATAYRAAPFQTVRLDYGSMPARGGDNITLNAYGPNREEATAAVRAGVRDLMWKKDRG